MESIGQRENGEFQRRLTFARMPVTSEIFATQMILLLLATGGDSNMTPDLISIPLTVYQTSPHSRSRHAFTLVEMLVVLVVIAIVTAFLIPALSPSSARALEGDARNFSAQLENARFMAISKRSKTRVLIASTNDWGADFSWRAYAVMSYDSISGNWLPQGKFYRLSQATTFDSGTGIVQARSSSRTAVVKAPNATPTPTPVNFTGAYVEFFPNGATSLDPSATPEVIAIQDGFVPALGSSPTPVRKNQNLKSQITIDPLTGHAILK